MEPNFDLHVSDKSGKSGWYKFKRKSMRRTACFRQVRQKRMV